MTLGLPTVCLDCGTPTRNGSRCPRCQRAYAQRHRTRYSTAERRRMRQTVADWVTAHGYLCVGYRRDSHPATNLVADHIISVRAREGGPLRVLCADCNRRRSGRQRHTTP
jgi:hypothetical protein